MTEIAFFFLIVAAIGMVSVIAVRKLIRKRKDKKLKELNDLIREAKARGKRN